MSRGEQIGPQWRGMARFPHRTMMAINVFRQKGREVRGDRMEHTETNKMLPFPQWEGWVFSGNIDGLWHVERSDLGRPRRLIMSERILSNARLGRTPERDPVKVPTGGCSWAGLPPRPRSSSWGRHGRSGPWRCLCKGAGGAGGRIAISFSSRLDVVS